MKLLLAVALVMMMVGTGQATDNVTLIDSKEIAFMEPVTVACAITFSGDNGTYAKLDWCDGVLKYSGDMPVEESAWLFISAFPEICDARWKFSPPSHCIEK